MSVFSAPPRSEGAGRASRTNYPTKSRVGGGRVPHFLATCRGAKTHILGVFSAFAGAKTPNFPARALSGARITPGDTLLPCKTKNACIRGIKQWFSAKTAYLAKFRFSAAPPTRSRVGGASYPKTLTPIEHTESPTANFGNPFLTLPECIPDFPKTR